MDARDLRERTLDFGLRIVRLCQYLGHHNVAEVLGKQLIRAGEVEAARVIPLQNEAAELRNIMSASAITARKNVK